MIRRDWRILLIVFALSSNVCGVYWSSHVDTNSSHWSIYRESSNLSFNLSSFVEGKISPVESRYRSLHPYQSYYEEVGTDGVRLRQRTNATTNVIERINKELKRRSRPVGAFPSDKSLLRLAGCILININEEWITGKKYLSMDEE